MGLSGAKQLAIALCVATLVIATSPVDAARASPASELRLERANRAMFADYVAGFNSQDVDRFAPRFYAPEIVFERKDHRFTRGRDQYIAEYHASHAGLTEVLRPVRVLVDGNQIAAELNVDFVATKDQPNFIIMPLKAGDRFTVKMFAFYTVVNGKFTYIKVSRWNPGQE
jgi:SnoaL-like domain